MKPLFSILLLVLISSCATDTNSSKIIWEKNKNEFEDIVILLKSEKLRIVYGRAGYDIPDSFRLKAIAGSVVFRETDFTYDSSFSILFRVGFDSSHLLRKYPTFVYTDNLKRQREYDSNPKQVEKLEDNWYFLSND